MDDPEIEILLVEDNHYDADLAIRALKKQNLANRLTHLNDGAKALDFIFGTGEYATRNIGNTPKVIFLDLKMPKVNGLEVLQRIKSDERTKSIPVIILTSSSEDPDIKRSYELGASGYIVKPVEFINVAKTLSSLGLYWMVVSKA